MREETIRIQVFDGVDELLLEVETPKSGLINSIFALFAALKMPIKELVLEVK